MFCAQTSKRSVIYKREGRCLCGTPARNIIKEGTDLDDIIGKVHRAAAPPPYMEFCSKADGRTLCVEYTYTEMGCLQWQCSVPCCYKTTTDRSKRCDFRASARAQKRTRFPGGAIPAVCQSAVCPSVLSGRSGRLREERASSPQREPLREPLLPS
jgi:hypothetical protein